MATSDRKQPHVVFLTIDEMMALDVISNALLENGGRLSALGELEISDQFKTDLRSALKKLDTKISEIGK